MDGDSRMRRGMPAAGSVGMRAWAPLPCAAGGRFDGRQAVTGRAGDVPGGAVPPALERTACASGGRINNGFRGLGEDPDGHEPVIGERICGRPPAGRLPVRFFSEGPDIPDDLLMRRDRGQVVFVCGAGVSMSSGMPSFARLAEYVVDGLGVPGNSEIRKGLAPWLDGGSGSTGMPLDRIFSLLYKEYDKEDVHDQVEKRLHAASDGVSGSVQHRHLLKISSNAGGKPQIVTTNLDRLFEREHGFPKRRIFQPPTLPAVREGASITGITYLHGRLRRKKKRGDNYVLGSEDLGRAYLAEGWATRFVRSLIRSYTVVFIGYSAEDPPMKYLLEGLKNIADAKPYAFDKGSRAGVRASWEEMGVEGIGCKSYDALWETMEEWAKRATCPGRWNRKVVSIAQRIPREAAVAPHERGQVAHLIGTSSGAKLFAEANPVPSAEWLCVFDVSCRLPEKWPHAGGDRMPVYALESELPESLEEEARTVPPPHFLGWRQGDGMSTEALSLNRFAHGGTGELPLRLEHLIGWIVRAMASPVAAWWVALTRRMHPRLLKLLRAELSINAGMRPGARRIWDLILEYHEDRRGPEWDSVWADIEHRINESGWTEEAIRRFEEMAAPILRPCASQLNPYVDGFSDLSWENFLSSHVMEWRVCFPDQAELERPVPDGMLPLVFGIAERHFIRFAGFTKKSCDNPSGEAGRVIRRPDPGAAVRVRWFLGLFQQMLSAHRDLLKARVLAWPKDDPLFFGNFHLRALSEEELFRPDEAGEIIRAIFDEQFRDRHHRAGLLSLVEDRWELFSEEVQADLINRILDVCGAESGSPGPDYQDGLRKGIDFINLLQEKGSPTPGGDEAKSGLESLIAEAGRGPDPAKNPENPERREPAPNGTTEDPEALSGSPSD